MPDLLANGVNEEGMAVLFSYLCSQNSQDGSQILIIIIVMPITFLFFLKTRQLQNHGFRRRYGWHFCFFYFIYRLNCFLS